jgi:hypothetical protein
MKALLIILLCALGGFGQERVKKIGEIEFFGYSGVDVRKLRGALPIREGQELRTEKKGELAKILISTKKAVQRIAKRPATDVTPVCCDSRGDWMIYIGLSGKAAQYRSDPKGIVRLPAEIINLYDRHMDAFTDAVRRGVAGEDRSKGYALRIDPAARKLELEMREYALAQEALLRDVLENSADAKHRAVAAEILGYAERSKQQINALADAAKDSDSTVRSNATRALGVLAQSNPKLAAEIPIDFFIDLLMSGQWTDLNKAGLLLHSIAISGEQRPLAALRRSDVTERLIETARWRTGHAEMGQYVLGRIAGIPEERLKLLIDSGNAEEIIKSIHP